MRLFFIATTDLASARADDLQRLFSSLQQQPAEVLPTVRLLLVLQNATRDLLDQVGPLPDFVRIVTVGTRVSLSRARNLCLRRLREAGALTSGALIAFPDDNCWYTPDVLARVTDMFKADRRLGLWFCGFGSEPRSASGHSIEGRDARAKDVVRKVASITMVIRGDVAAEVGLFDETLGLGTQDPGGEDLDYALRGFLASPMTRMSDVPLIGHRDRRPAPRASHYGGNLVALAKHADRSAGISVALMRKLAVGCLLVLRGELSPLGWFGALRRAAGARNTGRDAARLPAQ